MFQRAGVIERLNIYKRDEDGKLVLIRSPAPINWYDKLVEKVLRIFHKGKCCNDILTNDGISDIRSLIQSRYEWISIGVGGTLPATTDVQLVSEIQTRIHASKSATSTFYPDDTVRFEGEFVATADRTIQEAGIHLKETTTDDVMACRETYIPISLLSGQSVYIVWDMVVTR